MKDTGPGKPRSLFEALEHYKADNPEAHLICTECRQQHGGWCIDEFTTDVSPECPLASIAAFIGEHPPAPEPPEDD